MEKKTWTEIKFFISKYLTLLYMFNMNWVLYYKQSNIAESTSDDALDKINKHWFKGKINFQLFITISVQFYPFSD